MIRCGWCGDPTANRLRCDACGRDPELPYAQRGTAPVEERHGDGRPALDASAIRQSYQAARAALASRGREATVEAIAEELDRSPRTVRDWRRRFGLDA